MWSCLYQHSIIQDSSIAKHHKTPIIQTNFVISFKNKHKLSIIYAYFHKQLEEIIKWMPK